MNMGIPGNWIQLDSGQALDADALDRRTHRIAERLSAYATNNNTLAFAGLPAELAPAVVIGAWKAGWTVAPLRVDASAAMRDEMRRQLGDGIYISHAADAADAAGVDTSVVVAEPCARTPLEDWLAAPSAQLFVDKQWSPDETAAVLFTSGSSGIPKGVAHSQCNLLRAAELFADHFQLAAGETLVCMAPPHTASGLRSLLLPMVRPVDVALWPREAASLAEAFTALAMCDPQVLLCGPRFVATLAAAGKRVRRQLPSLRLIVSTGAPVGVADRASVMQALGIEVLDFYGLTETGGIVLAEHPGSPRPGLLPPACKGVTLHLANIPDRPNVFELEVQGPNVFLGYLHEPRFRRAIFATGDLVQCDPDGSLRLVGRRDKSFKAGNTEWVYPERLQDWLCRQGTVRDAHVESMPESAGTCQALLATLEIEEGAEPPDLAQWMGQIARELGSEYAQVRLTLGAVQRSALGKVQKA